jgi:hypothetical protein
MLTRTLRFILLPMLAALLAIPAIARAAAPDDDSSMHCDSDRESQSPGRAPPAFVPDSTDGNTASTFSAIRSLTSDASAPSSSSAHISICRATVTLTPSSDGNAHLSIDLSKALPSGQLASSLVHRFLLSDSGLHLEIKAPEGANARIHLALPVGTATEFALVRGDLNVLRLFGNAHIAIVKGNATLHLADADFATLQCAAVLGGIRDRRPGGGSHGHVLSSWTAHGTGAANIQMSAVSGDLILLPPTS